MLYQELTLLLDLAEDSAQGCSQQSTTATPPTSLRLMSVQLSGNALNLGLSGEREDLLSLIGTVVSGSWRGALTGEK